MDHYELLGLTREADARAVARAFRRAARDAHPDRGGDAERFRAIEEAYRVLVDPDLRRRYDRTLDGDAHSWDDVEWGVEVAPPPSPDPTPGDEGPDAGRGLDWDDDPGWGEGVVGGAPRGTGADGRGGGSRRPDPFVGGPVRLPDPLAPSIDGASLPRAGLRELAAGLGVAVLGAVACVTRWAAIDTASGMSRAPFDEDAAAVPPAALTVLFFAAYLHAHPPRSSGGGTLTWLLTVAAALVWMVDVPVHGVTGAMWASMVAGPAAVMLAVIWARIHRNRMSHPARLEILRRRNIGWRIDRHHRAEEWNRVRAALQVPGRTVVLVGPAPTDADGRPLPGRRWTFDPRTGGQKVRVLGDASPQGSWVVVDRYGRLVVTAPAWSLEAWLDVLREE